MKRFVKKLLKVLMWIGISLGSLAALFFLVYLLILPRGPRELMDFDDPFHTAREAVVSERHMASAGTPWAAQAAMDVLDGGGNAFDAAVSALLALNVTANQAASFPGVAPILLYDAENNIVRSYIGAGTAPAAATVDFFHGRGHDYVPNLNILAQLLPASPDVLIAILTEYGTMSFAELAQPAIELARYGFPIHQQMANDMDFSLIERIGFSFLMPYNAQVYLRGEWWRPLHPGDRMVLPDLAGTLEALANVEQQVLIAGGSREDGLLAVRDYFYSGPIAQMIVDYHERRGGLITFEDLQNYRGGWEEPLSGTFGAYTVFANQTWTQGGVVPMVLQILDGVDLYAMGHNSPEYVHTVIQAIELTMADRERYFGDPVFVDVPMGGLLSPEFAAARRAAMTPGAAFVGMPPAGNPFAYQDMPPRNPLARLEPTAPTPSNGAARDFTRDTSYIAIVDQWGNAVSLTPSDFPESPMIPGTGLTLGTRLNQFVLDETRANGLMPGKRPRITPNPSMVLRDGEFFMTFGTPGGESQTQAMIQVFLNIVVFGMDPQEAIEAPRFISMNWPNSFAPHRYYPGRIQVEAALYDVIGSDLRAKGYRVDRLDDWVNAVGAVCAILRDPATGLLIGGADPRESSLALGA
ncbi:MAG: gamma-glutamyltransferase [Oscillospiraceae bacterium]|nr:gamma-glutamyltransferase [Oscillospiraceae bacterium]